MMMSGHAHTFHITGPLCGESVSYQWIPSTKTSYAQFDDLFIVILDELLKKQTSSMWNEMY